MTNDDSDYHAHEPGLAPLLVAVITGAGFSFVIATHLLALTPFWVAHPVGGIFGALGLLLGETIVEAVVFTLILGLLVFLFITTGPDIAFIRAGIIPVASGLCCGKLLSGIGKGITGRPSP